MFRANTTVSVLTSIPGVDEWGDPEDNDTVVASGIPASITDVSPIAYSENSTRPRTIRYSTIRVSSRYADVIDPQCRIRDERAGYTWIILDIVNANNVAGHTPLRIDATRTN